MISYLASLLMISSAYALEVIRPIYKNKIHLKVIRAEADSFSTYNLMNHNGREMLLVCSNNRVYDNNPLPIIKYRNFFGEEAGDFILESEEVCQEMGRLIEKASFGIDERRPFLITLSTKDQRVERIVYPSVDPYSDTGEIEDLLPKERVFIRSKAKPSAKPVKSPQRH